MTTEELLAKIKDIEADQKNRMPPGSLWLYTAAARKRLDKLYRSIADNQRQKRIANGEPINDEGYSGRKTNRR